MDAEAQARAGCVLDRDYPLRIVDHEEAARFARERVHAVRRDAGFGDEARGVLRRHASRKRGRDASPAQKAAKARRAGDGQLSLDL